VLEPGHLRCEGGLESKNASSMLALRKRCAILTITYYILRVTFCQEKRRSGVFHWEDGTAGGGRDARKQKGLALRTLRIKRGCGSGRRWRRLSRREKQL
jgi:hypothetical protein